MASVLSGEIRHAGAPPAPASIADPAGEARVTPGEPAPQKPAHPWRRLFTRSRSAGRDTSTPRLKQLVYRSHGTGLMSLGALESLLLAARAKNRSLGVTGLLIHHQSQYVQCLEGPLAAVDAVFQAISADPRHERVVVLQEGMVARRSFTEWNMACARVNQSAWLQMSRAAWEHQLSGRAKASSGFTLMRNAWLAAGDKTTQWVQPSPV